MTNASLIPEQGIKVGLNTAYLVTDQIIENTQYANEWAVKTDGLVRNTDYSAKAYAIGGTGTETNNALYYKNQASASATGAATSATSAANSATSASNSATSAQNWATGTLAQQPEGSAKYWAESINVNNLLKTNQISNCILSAPNGVATYSGNTVTVKSGLKVLIPNGRNADGTLNNIEYTLSSDASTTETGVFNRVFLLSNSGVIQRVESSNYLVGNLASRPSTLPTTNTTVYFCIDTNIMYSSAGSTTASWSVVNLCYIGKFSSTTSGTITSLTPEQPVQLVKMSDKETVVGWGMPDYSRSTPWTCPATGQTFTVPYDCEIRACDFNNGTGFLGLRLNNSTGQRILSMTSGNNVTYVEGSINLKKGNVVYVENTRQCSIYQIITPFYGE